MKTSLGDEPALAPLILSASRTTDIPAFHAEWFMERLKKEYFRWINPYNRQQQVISTEKLKAIVFWTKNPEPFYPWLDILDRYGWVYYFQFTLNDYEQEDLEPYVPLLAQRVAAFQKLANRLGKDRVIWRFDPLIRTAELPPDLLLTRIRTLGEQLAPYTRKLVFSVAHVDRYAKVRRRMKTAGIPWLCFNSNEINHLVGCLSEQCHQWQIQLASCAETIDFSSLGVQSNRCIDADLLAHLTQDTAFLTFLGYERTMFGLQKRSNSPDLTDTGQRKACQCMASKDIGTYNTCRHGCRYCYAMA